MKYLVVTDSQEPFLTNRFDSLNQFDAEDNMIIFDLIKRTYTTDGHTWFAIKFITSENHL
jgi:hypothetical protein